MIGFKKDIDVDVHDVDFNGICRASSLMRYIQSAAQTQLTENGMSYDNLKARDRAFILSRIRLEFYEPIYSYDKLEAHTFPCISRGYSFLRCYGLYRNGVTVGRAISLWALIDTKNRGLVKVADFDLNLPTYEPWENLALSHIKLPTAMQKIGNYTVTYADIDQNNHINNTKYADIFANFLPLDKRRIDTMTINYMNEAKYRDTLDVYLAETDEYFYIRTILPDGKINAEAEIHLCKIN